MFAACIVCLVDFADHTSSLLRDHKEAFLNCLSQQISGEANDADGNQPGRICVTVRRNEKSLQFLQRLLR